MKWIQLVWPWEIHLTRFHSVFIRIPGECGSSPDILLLFTWYGAHSVASLAFCKTQGPLLELYLYSSLNLNLVRHLLTHLWFGRQHHYRHCHSQVQKYRLTHLCFRHQHRCRHCHIQKYRHHSLLQTHCPLILWALWSEGLLNRSESRQLK